MTRPLSERPTAIYARGYNAAMRKLLTIRQEYGRAFAAIRQRAERAEAGLGRGTCDGCRFWRRKEGCQWGYCDMQSALKAHPDWPAPWSHVECGEFRCIGQQKLSTHQTFGCVLFMQSNFEA